jgi:hypothetical protein
MRYFGKLVLLCAIAVSTQVMAYGEMQSLMGSQVVATGDIQQVTCPIGGKYDCLSWPADLYEMTSQNICFTASVSCGYSCEGFIAQKNQINTVYVLGSYPKLSSSSIQLFKCPNRF